jgi:hypothetical protein
MKKRLMVQIIPIVISKTGNFHTRTLAEIAQLVSFKENPPNNITYKSLPPQAQTIAWHITSTHNNGSHLCPKSPKAPSPNAGKQQRTQQQITTTTKR